MMSKRLALGICVVAAMALVGISVSAGTVSAVVDPINALSSETYFTDVSGESSANLGATDAKIASGVINNNDEDGWKLTVTSANNGKLIRTAEPLNEIQYTSIKLVKTTGTLGTGLDNPEATESVVSGSCVFTAGTATKATTATVDYAFELQISWAADDTLVSGTYEDSITMTLTVDGV